MKPIDKAPKDLVELRQVADEPLIQINITADAAREASRKALQKADELYKTQLSSYLIAIRTDAQNAIQKAIDAGKRNTIFQMPSFAMSPKESEIRREGLRKLDDALSAQGFSTSVNAQLMTIKIDWQ